MSRNILQQHPASGDLFAGLSLMYPPNTIPPLPATAPADTTLIIHKGLTIGYSLSEDIMYSYSPCTGISTAFKWKIVKSMQIGLSDGTSVTKSVLIKTYFKPVFFNVKGFNNPELLDDEIVPQENKPLKCSFYAYKGKCLAINYESGVVYTYHSRNFSPSALKGWQVTGYESVQGYLKTKINGVSTPLHRIIMECFYGRFINTGHSHGLQIDHKDRNKSNNALSNIRLVTPHENSLNRSTRCDNEIGLTGLHYSTRFKKWTVQWYKGGLHYTKTKRVTKRFTDLLEATSFIKSPNSEYSGNGKS